MSNAFENINQNLFTGLIFLNLRKAFDIVSHSILLSKLDHYGIRGSANQLIKPFLNRRQYVSVNGTNSDIKLITNGVAQGTTLGPILFLLHINDLYNSTNCLRRLFADDTCLVLYSPDPNNLEHIMNNELRNVDEWCRANKLSLNPSKSNFLIIPPRLRKSPPNISLNLNNVEINPFENVKNLGVQIDSQLNFNLHIRMIENTISRSIGIIIKLKSFLPSSALLKLYYAIVHPHLLYGLLIWGTTYTAYLAKLYSLQNKVVRHIGGGSYREHSTPYYHNLKILKVPDLLKLETAKFAFRHLQNNLPPLIFNLFIKTSDISVRHTRSSNPSNSLSLYIPKYHSARLQRCIRYQGVKIWNYIPLDIKNKTYNFLKRNYKKYLLNQY